MKYLTETASIQNIIVDATFGPFEIRETTTTFPKLELSIFPVSYSYNESSKTLFIKIPENMHSLQPPVLYLPDKAYEQITINAGFSLVMSDIRAKNISVTGVSHPSFPRNREKPTLFLSHVSGQEKLTVNNKYGGIEAQSIEAASVEIETLFDHAKVSFADGVECYGLYVDGTGKHFAYPENFRCFKTAKAIQEASLKTVHYTTAGGSLEISSYGKKM